MRNINPFLDNGNWYKGNLHCHSTNSDGRLPPSEIIRLYMENGWNFLALTEHRFYTDCREYDCDDFLLLPGVELDVNKYDPLRMYHFLGIGKTLGDNPRGFKHGDKFDSTEWKGMSSAQAEIDKLVSSNNLAVFNHPDWSRMELEDFIGLDDFFAMEIFNYGCHIESCTGLSTYYWDSLLRRGRKIWGMATDDAHHILNDRCGGWIMVNCPELTHKNIIEALMEGRFYSSSGPEIYKYFIADGKVHVECSPVDVINFITYEDIGYSEWAGDKGTINSAEYKLKGTEKYVRVECVDRQGMTAWSNPIFIQV